MMVYPVASTLSNSSVTKGGCHPTRSHGFLSWDATSVRPYVNSFEKSLILHDDV